MVTKPDIATMADGEQIGRVVVPLVVIDVMDNKGASVSGFCHSASLAAMAVSITDSGSQTASETGAVLASQPAHPCRITRSRQIAPTIGRCHVCQPRSGAVSDSRSDHRPGRISAAVPRASRLGSQCNLLRSKRYALARRRRSLFADIPRGKALFKASVDPIWVMSVSVSGRSQFLADWRDHGSAAAGARDCRQFRNFSKSSFVISASDLVPSQSHLAGHRSVSAEPGAIALWRNSARVAPSVDRALPPASPGKGV